MSGRISRHALTLFTAVVAALLVTPAARAAVSVKKKPPAVERKTFDPANPPPERPHLHAGELAVTSSEFGCTAQVEFVPRRGRTGDGGHSVSYSIQGVRMTLELKVVIWNPTNATEKLKAHEEGHREISEIVYKSAEVHAKAAGAKLNGKRIVGEGDTPQEAKKAADDAMVAANREVCEEYIRQTSRPSVKVQEIYDELTRHGVEPLDEKEAIRQAFARHAKETGVTFPGAATKPATRPAARPPTSAPARPPTSAPARRGR